MELNETIEMMSSDDYKERFKAEYAQTYIRYSKLYRMLIKYKAGTLNFVPSCPYEILDEQLLAMRRYLMLLAARAENEKIDLNDFGG